MKPGCYTALVTPFTADGRQIDQDGLRRLATFQIENGIDGILAVGTTGESPTLDWQEHHDVVAGVVRQTRDRCLCIAGAGSNNTKEALAATEHAASLGVDAVLLVDPYYNGPSSLEIRREYVAPIARRFSQLTVIPYVIPGRTGAQLLAEDLALLHKECPNVSTVKEATGNLDNMRHTRSCCGPDFIIFSGDDALTFEMMIDPAIAAAGVISVASNIAPASVSQMVQALQAGDVQRARDIKSAIEPLFGLVTVTTTEDSPVGPVKCRARNPLAIKTLMALLGMPVGPCRQPLGKMTRQGLDVVLDIARGVYSANPEVFQPLADFFNVDVGRRLDDPQYQEGLVYATY